METSTLSYPRAPCSLCLISSFISHPHPDPVPIPFHLVKNSYANSRGVFEARHEADRLRYFDLQLLCADSDTLGVQDGRDGLGCCALGLAQQPIRLSIWSAVIFGDRLIAERTDLSQDRLGAEAVVWSVQSFCTLTSKKEV